MKYFVILSILIISIIAALIYIANNGKKSDKGKFVNPSQPSAPIQHENTKSDSGRENFSQDDITRKTAVSSDSSGHYATRLTPTSPSGLIVTAISISQTN
ncbi:MAG: hypothetical protein V1701_12625, partial [Planctomycetota bacterium]